MYGLVATGTGAVAGIPGAKEDGTGPGLAAYGWKAAGTKHPGAIAGTAVTGGNIRKANGNG